MSTEQDREKTEYTEKNESITKPAGTEMPEEKTVRRLYFVWEFEKEEAWLNEMAMNGWILVKPGMLYFKFRRCEPGEYTVRLELHDNDPDFMDLMKDSGAEYIGHVMKWQYFKKKVSLGEFDLFSDLSSKIEHLNRIDKMLTVIGDLNLFCGLVNGGSINLLCAALLAYGLGRIHGKKEALEKENLLRE